MGKWLFRLLAISIFTLLVAFILYIPVALERYGVSGSRELNILSWPQMFSERALEAFEEQHGVKVNVTYFDNNEEFLTKLTLAGGSEYDIVTPADFGLPDFAERNLLEALNDHHVPELAAVHERLVKAATVNGELLAIPYAITIYGIGLQDTQRVDRPSWKQLFEEHDQHSRVCMTDDPVEVLNIAFQYLAYHNPAFLEKTKIEQAAAVQQLLREQRKWVEAYTDVRIDYLLKSGACTAAMVPSHAVALARKLGANIQFYIPEEGGFLVIEYLAMSAQSRRKELAAAFINFMLQPEYSLEVMSEFGMLSASPAVARQQDLSYLPEHGQNLDAFYHLPFMQRLFDHATINRVWMAIKA